MTLIFSVRLTDVYMKLWNGYITCTKGHIRAVVNEIYRTYDVKVSFERVVIFLSIGRCCCCGGTKKTRLDIR